MASAVKTAAGQTMAVAACRVGAVVGGGAGASALAGTANTADKPRWAAAAARGGCAPARHSLRGRGSRAPFVAAPLAVGCSRRNLRRWRFWLPGQSCAARGRTRASALPLALVFAPQRRGRLGRAGARFPVAARRLRFAGAAASRPALGRLGRAPGRGLRRFGALALLARGCRWRTRRRYR